MNITTLENGAQIARWLESTQGQDYVFKIPSPNALAIGCEARIMDLGSEMVRVIVSADKEPFTFHKNLIRRHSEYCSRVFGPNFRGGDEGILYLAEADETSCRIFQTWAYMQIARSPHPMVAAFQNSDDQEPDPSHVSSEAIASGTLIQDLVSEDTETALKGRLIALYIFADAYECVALRNDIMSAFVRLNIRSNTFMGFDVAPAVFGSVPSSSTLCRYIIKSTARYWYTGRYDSKDMESQPQEFISKLLALQAQQSQEDWGDEEFAGGFDRSLQLP